jgi:hypothetical protein
MIENRMMPASAGSNFLPSQKWRLHTVFYHRAFDP